MSKNRPINRRPWRKKPWAKKRPTRWNASTNGVDELNLALNTAVFPGSTPTSPIAILCDGQIDVEPWADEQEVTIDRIVGNLHFYGWTIRSTIEQSVTLPQVLLKVGIVLNEELTDEVPAPVVLKNLWDQESYEDTEWIWLHSQLMPMSDMVVDATNDVYGRQLSLSIPIDIRNRRKIGQRDELAVYASWVVTQSNWNVALQSYTDVRCILMSR